MQDSGVGEHQCPEKMRLTRELADCSEQLRVAVQRLPKVVGQPKFDECLADAQRALKGCETAGTALKEHLTEHGC